MNRIEDNLELERLSLPADVDVYRTRLTRPAAQVRELATVLSLEERSRAARLQCGTDRERFTISRALLRLMLAERTGMRPDQLTYARGPYGKPFLPDAGGVRFNLSNDGDVALFAVADDREVGIDVERVQPMANFLRVAERFFSPSERTALRGLAEHQRLEGFFTCWTRKEAFIKATGEGVSANLERFDVSLTPGEPARLLRVGDRPEAAEHWRMSDLKPEPGYVAALVVERPGGGGSVAKTTSLGRARPAGWLRRQVVMK